MFPYIPSPHYIKMRTIDFVKIRNTSDLAKHLSCRVETIIKLAFDELQENNYLEMEIPKRNGSGYRTVYKSENQNLTLIHKNLETSINQTKIFPECVQGFVRNRSIVTNARKHLAKKYVLNADIENFFESIDMAKVIDAFKYINCNDAIADVLSRICTIDERLVQGLSTSPVISNLACREMDIEMAALGKKNDCCYTRYADDMTFSGETVPEREEVETILSNYGFKLNSRKYSIQRRGQKQYVTGLTVFDDKYPRITKRKKKQIRSILYYASKYGLESHCNKIGIDSEFDIEGHIRKIDGWIAFMFSVEPRLACKFRIKWIKIKHLYGITWSNGIGDTKK